MSFVLRVPDDESIRKVVTIFREPRSGLTLDGKEKVKSPSGVISTAEAISLLTGSMALAGSFGTGELSDDDIAAGLQGAIVKDDLKDQQVWKEYLDNIMKNGGVMAKPIQRLHGDERLSDGPHYFGVRHLSPAGSYHLLALLQEVKPTAVLIEGPSDAGILAEQLTARGVVPPVAMLAYTDRSPVRTLLYPFAEYSPEYQAPQWAKWNDCQAEFIDLPTEVSLALADVKYDWKPVNDDGDQEESERPVDLYSRIAELSGEPDYEAYWERHFEHHLRTRYVSQCY